MLLRARMRLNIVFAHEGQELAWDLFKNLFGKQVRIPLKLVKGHELNDIRTHVLTIRLRIESLIICIKLETLLNDL